ncbi:hypothetical protein BDZ85DRAFT_269525 [Elsinoe ampelina]|uniref:Uncharacterized protein n=1 Tax=Elsinoe ampelina TaxID=302913 RepID=A0A6A6FZP2_9PEZI|nr:hypothetical protein BDZ85DRAFT_269525 [Elsinoe ampelina]
MVYPLTKPSPASSFHALQSRLPSFTSCVPAVSPPQSNSLTVQSTTSHTTRLHLQPPTINRLSHPPTTQK